MAHVDYSIEQLRDINGLQHFTSKYDVMKRDDGAARLVVRRGQEFHLRCLINEPYDTKKITTHVKFILNGHDVADSRNGTVFIGLQSKTAGYWAVLAEPATTMTNAISLKVFTPAKAPIGQWKMAIQLENKDTKRSLNMLEEFDLLFNPWADADTVFLATAEARQEYVMAESAMIYRGLVSYMVPTMWLYSQFDHDILNCAFYLLFEIANIPFESLHDPALVARTLCAYINNNTGNGVIIGNWSDDFRGGTSPLDWLGSRDILQKYFATKRPVKYGQCWVFAGVFTTLCRALGIPCRTITTFEAAHDNNLSLTVDRYVAAKDKPDLNLTKCNTEFIWDFHLWNEIWSKRDDIRQAYEDYVGWQAVDSTPPLNNAALHQRGPAPLIAVKNGKINVDYDCTYIFAEVNADEVYWTYTGDSAATVHNRTVTDSVGQKIVTQAIASTEVEEITVLYKYPEGSNEANKAMELAKSINALKPKIPNPCLKSTIGNPINFDFQMPENIMIGSLFSVKLKITNNDTIDHTIKFILHVESAHYTHRTKGKTIKSLTTEKKLTPRTVALESLDILWDDYRTKLLSQCMFTISCHATYSGAAEEFIEQKPFQLKKPSIIIELGNDAKVDKPLKAKASFINPLPIPLTNGIFLIEGPGLLSQLEIKITGNVQPGKKISSDFTLTPRSEGTAAIIAKFTSVELNDVNGFLIVKV